MAYHETEYLPLPQPDELEEREKEDAMGAYFMMFASLAVGLPLPFSNLVATLIYYYINKSDSRFVQFHAFQSLVSQIPITFVNAGAIVWLIYNFIYLRNDWIPALSGFIIFAVIANLAYFAFSIAAAVKSRKGRMYYFIFFGKWAYIHAFKKRPSKPTEEKVNKPPV